MPLAGIAILAPPAWATGAQTETPDDHAPIGIMGDHVHEPQELMFSYRHAHMEMDGNRDGNSRLSAREVLTDFPVTPLEMTMDADLFSLMYGFSERFTVMGMVPFVRKSMKHRTRMGETFTTRTSGLGDVKLSGMWQVFDAVSEARGTYRHRLQLNLGLSLPSGSTEKEGVIPIGKVRLPYPMQLGSGTLDPTFAATYVQERDTWSFGSQLSTVQRFGNNDEDYRLDDEYKATLWVARNVTAYLSVAFRLDGMVWGNIHGRDDRLNSMMAPTARTDLRGGERVDGLVSFNGYWPRGFLRGHRLAIEFGLPVYQRLDGPQLETDARLILGWQRAFKF